MLEGRPDPQQESLRDARVLLPQQFTPESLLDILKDQPSGLLVIDEFRMFFDALRRDYNSGLREMFMTLYDCRGVHRKIRSQEVASMIRHSRAAVGVRDRMVYRGREGWRDPLWFLPPPMHGPRVGKDAAHGPRRGTRPGLEAVTASQAGATPTGRPSLQ